MAVSNTLRQVRTERNICQEDLAIAIGSCGRTIGRIERGERNASLELALRLSKYLDVAVEELFVLEEEK
ncbi:helix-turn-helix transcriptional regulator [Roseburia sp. 831b]|uniref:helix-turn-helix transcriptional regulator n=1 Tax=Roseburia sp. 831b TaxID=1261635 RepID=UPI00095222B5|nr:helix-turn-helix transcriptional regulator [Roseburia sp. 831b]WVK74143.1 helix-turn-helix transcriptional regulator [Roseburia sp. 831b]